MINNVVIVGNLVADPQSQTTSTGTSVVHFRIAWNDSFSRRGDDKDRASIFLDVTAFGKVAESVAKNMHKGNQVGVIGRLNQRKYMSTKTGTEVTVTEIIANSVEFVGPKAASKTDDSGFQSDVPSTPVDTGFDAGFGDNSSNSSSSNFNMSDLGLDDDDVPF
ncbi:MAG: single-stranded DNA-binding protein [Bacilli bacterium]|nr:single-stranded DNA-binding protein [Bacilli bacterium]